MKTERNYSISIYTDKETHLSTEEIKKIVSDAIKNKIQDTSLKIDVRRVYCED